MNTPVVTTRAATAADAALIAEVGARTFRDAFGEANTESDMTMYLAGAFGPEIQAREIASSTFLLGEVDGIAVGYARLRQGPTPSCVDAERPIEIVRFYADVSWHGRGVGPTLMEACLAEAGRLGCDVIWLDVWEENPRAIAFYRKWGFIKVGEQEFVLGDDIQHDALMSRPVE
jgi:ribosomal protein S18 acetylase RimI-like enzyme